MRYSIVIIALFSIIGCRKKEELASVSIVGHGGMGLEIQNSIYHDNTAEAIELAMSIDGCDGVELDVQLAEDGQLWLYHDPNLDTETKSKGCIPSLTSNELSKVQYSTIHHEKLLKLNDLDVNQLQSKIIILDLKHYNECNGQFVDPEIFSNQLELFRSKLSTEHILYVTTNNPVWIPILVGKAFKVYFQVDTSEDFKVVDGFNGLDGIICRNELISKSEVNDWKEKDVKVIIFDVRSPKSIRKALKKLPNVLITDDVRATLIEKY